MEFRANEQKVRKKLRQSRLLSITLLLSSLQAAEDDCAAEQGFHEDDMAPQDKLAHQEPQTEPAKPRFSSAKQLFSDPSETLNRLLKEPAVNTRFVPVQSGLKHLSIDTGTFRAESPLIYPRWANKIGRNDALPGLANTMQTSSSASGKEDALGGRKVTQSKMSSNLESSNSHNQSRTVRFAEKDSGSFEVAVTHSNKRLSLDESLHKVQKSLGRVSLGNIGAAAGRYAHSEQVWLLNREGIANEGFTERDHAFLSGSDESIASLISCPQLKTSSTCSSIYKVSTV